MTLKDLKLIFFKKTNMCETHVVSQYASVWKDCKQKHTFKIKTYFRVKGQWGLGVKEGRKKKSKSQRLPKRLK